MGIENRGQFSLASSDHVMILQRNSHLCLASQQVQEKRDFVLRASQKGHLDVLTEKQRQTVGERYLSEAGIVVSFGLITERLGINVTRSAIQQNEKSAIRRLKRLRRGESTSRPKLEIDPDTRELLLQNKHLSIDALCKMVGHSEKIVVRWREELGIKRNPRWRPRREIPFDLIKNLYSDRHLSTSAIGEMFGCSAPVIINRLRTGGAEIRPPGPIPQVKINFPLIA